MYVISKIMSRLSKLSFLWLLKLRLRDSNVISQSKASQSSLLTAVLLPPQFPAHDTALLTWFPDFLARCERPKKDFFCNR